MATLRLDTHDFIKGLMAAGVPGDQAEAIAEGFQKVNLEGVVTKEDALAIRQELKADIATFREEAQENMHQLKTELLELKAELFRWAVPLFLGQAALIAALVKLL